VSRSAFISEEELRYEAKRQAATEAYAEKQRERAEREAEEYREMVEYLVWKYPPRWPPHHPQVWRIQDIGWLPYLEICVNLRYFDPRREHPDYRPALKVPTFNEPLQHGQVVARPRPLNKDTILANQIKWRKRDGIHG
jgi:hypothetical protein